jgi:hypothetical protein
MLSQDGLAFLRDEAEDLLFFNVDADLFTNLVPGSLGG